jgi:hypothetical protein
MEPIALHDGRIMQVHDEGSCLMANCCIHNPSEHPLDHAPLTWHREIHSMFRVCEHGQEHPDPDDLRFKAVSGDWSLLESITSIHLDHCDGCCMTEIP